MDVVRQLVESRPDSSPTATRTSSSRSASTSSSGSRPGSQRVPARNPAGRVIVNTGMGFEALTHKRLFDIDLRRPDAVHRPDTGTRRSRRRRRALPRAGDAGSSRSKTSRICQRDDAAHQARARRRRPRSGSARSLPRWRSVRPAPRHRRRQDVPVADMSFEDRHDLEVGGLRIELHATPGGETIDSCVAWLPQHRSAVFGQRVRSAVSRTSRTSTRSAATNTGRSSRYLDSLRRIRALEPELLITGHFAPVARPRADPRVSRPSRSRRSTTCIRARSPA